MNEQPVPTIGKMLLVGMISITILTILFFAVRAYGRDLDGHYANSPNREWFKSQRNSAGQWCCDEADGHAYDGDYTVNPDGSISIGEHTIESYKVLRQPNPTGHAVWWYVDSAMSGRTTYCFIPGTLS